MNAIEEPVEGEYVVPKELPGREITVTDPYGFEHEATLVEAAQEPGKKGLVALMVPGIPPGSQNMDIRPMQNHPFFAALSPVLAQNGIHSLAMNPQGIGHSSGDTWDESLETRTATWVEAAKVAIVEAKADPEHVYLIGSSMGAHIVLRMIERLAKDGIMVESLVLLSPAAYAQIAEDQTFRIYKDKDGHESSDFSRALRQASEEEKASSPAIEALDKFSGKILMIYTEHEDNNVPQDVRKLYYDHLVPKVKTGQAQTHELPGSRHGFKIPGEAKKYHEPSIKTATQLVTGFLTQ